MEDEGNYTDIVPDEGKNKKKSKDDRIKKEMLRLNKILKNLSENTKKVADSLIKNAAFMTVTLEDLQYEINLNGCVSEYKNGENQFGTKKSPEVEIYNAMIKNHSTIMKQLTDLLPKESPKSEDDGFDKFVGGRDD